MDYGSAILLGLWQGLTEFLPVSSTAHLTLVGKMFHLVSDKQPEQWTAFIAVIQMGTLLAVLGYFAKDIQKIVYRFWQENIRRQTTWSQQSEDSRMGWLVSVGTLPVVIFGYLLKHVIEGPWTKDLLVMAFSLIVFALLLGWAEIGQHKRSSSELTLKDALWVGVAQVCALIPGASRSGTTLTAGLFLGLKRSTAARFSFLLSLPAVLLSGLFELKQALPYLDGHLVIVYTLGLLFSFVSGWAVIAWWLKWLNNHSTWIFVAYRLVLGMGIISFVLLT